MVLMSSKAWAPAVRTGKQEQQQRAAHACAKSGGAYRSLTASLRVGELSAASVLTLLPFVFCPFLLVLFME